MSPRRNPYVGPGAFRRGDAEQFFGRDDEARRLKAMVVSEDVGLFYARSGAGKSSLINARLILDLNEDGFDVLPIARVGGESRLEVEPDNVYVFNVLTTLILEPEQEAHASELAGQTLAGYLDERFQEATDTRRVLIIDQFEEVLTTHPQRRPDRADFFRQLQEALEAWPTLSVLLVMREDMIAGLDDFVPYLRNRLRARLRMKRLSREAAVLAVREPARLARRPFAEGVAESLVELLSQERVTGQEEPLSGGFVEPVQLQVVCRQVWDFVESKLAAAQEITGEHLEQFGKVDDALARFFDQAVSDTARNPDVSEVDIRRWFRMTITRQGLRAQVPYDPELDMTGSLKTSAVEELIKKHHLIRPERVRGGIWLELIHDAFVEPIRFSNAEWFAHMSPLAAAAQALESGKPDYLDLYPDRCLDTDLERARAHPFSDGEKRVLEEAQKRRRNRRLRAASATVVLVFLGMMAFFSLQLWHAGTQQLISTGRIEIETSPVESLRTTLDAADRFLATSTFAQGLEAVLREGLHHARLRLLWSRPAKISESSFAWSADGRHLVSADDEGTVTVRTAESGNVVGILGTRWPRITWLATNHDGSLVAVFGLGQALLWSPGSGDEVPLGGVPERPNGAAFSPDGAWLAAVGKDHTLLLWTTRTGDLRSRPIDDAGELLSVAWSPDGLHLAIGDSNGRIHLEIAGGPVETFSNLEREDVEWLGFSPEGRHLVTAGQGIIVAWSVDTREAFAWGTLDGRPVVDAAWSTDGHYLVTLTDDGTVAVWNRHLWKGAIAPAVSFPSTHAVSQPVPGGLAPSGRRLARRSEERLEMLELVLEETPILAGHDDEVRALAFDRRGRRLASASDDRTVRLWHLDSRDGDPPRVFEDSEPVAALAFSPDGTRLFSADLAGRIRTRNMASGAIVQEWSSPRAFEAVSADPLSGRLAAVDVDGNAVVWDPGPGEVSSSFPVVRAATADGHEGTIVDVALGPHGRRLATSGEDLTIRLWDVGSGRWLSTLKDLSEKTSALAFSPDGRSLASADLYQILVWDTGRGRRVARFPWRHDVLALAFDPEGRYLASAGRDGLVRLDLLELEQLIELASGRIPTKEEDHAP